MKVYASCSSYVLGQLFGMAEACALITQAIQDESRKAPCFAVESLRHLAKLCEVTLYVNGGSSLVGRARSLQFYGALQSEADVWLSIDDDVNVPRETLETLLQAVSRDGAHIVSVPCLLRGKNRINVQFSDIVLEERLPNGATLRNIVSSGFGLVAMNRLAMKRIAAVAPTWRDPTDGEVKPAPFLEFINEHGTWFGEDIAFFRRVPRGTEGVQVSALTSGNSNHAGHELALESLRA